MHRTTLRLAAVALTLAASAFSAIAGDFDTLRVAGSVNIEDMIAGPGTTAAVLSPDGGAIAQVDRDGVCFHSVTGASVTEVACVLPEGERLRSSEDMYWSPDGRYLVLPTQMTAFSTFRDTDVVVIDAATLEVTNLTDDGLEGRLIETGPGELDTGAHWLDEDTLIFVRQHISPGGMPGGMGTPTLMTVYLNGEVTEVHALSGPRTIVSNFGLSPDGLQVAYVVEGDAKLAGLYVLDLGTNEPRRIATRDEIGKVGGISYSADGKYLALAFNDIEGLEVTIVEAATGALTRRTADLPIAGFAWSPTGSALAYITSNGSRDELLEGLYIAEPPTAPGRLLLEASLMVPACCNQPVVWAANDTMVLGNRDKMDQPYLLRFVR